jgi:hypothetical protein
LLTFDSTWKLDLNSQVRSFAYKTISDVVLHVRYTAQQDSSSGGADRVNTFLGKLAEQSKAAPLCLYSDLRSEWATAWAAFRATGVLTLQNLQSRLPLFARGGCVKVETVRLEVESKSAQTAGATLSLGVGGKDVATNAMKLTGAVNKSDSHIFALMQGGDIIWSGGVESDVPDWTFTLDNPPMAKELASMQLLVGYTLKL